MGRADELERWQPELIRVHMTKRNGHLERQRK